MRTNNGYVTRPDAETFRAAMGCFPTGVALLTRGSGPDTEVVTVSCFVSVSLDPMLVLVSLQAGGRPCTEVAGGEGFAVNVLAASHEAESALFARHDRPHGEAAVRRLGGVAGVTGNLVVPGALVCFECERFAEYPGGDHVLFLGRVVAIHCQDPDRQPLLFHRSRYATIS